MSKHIIFLPCCIYERKSAYLYGVVRSGDKNEVSMDVTCYYVLNVEPGPMSMSEEKKDNENFLLGLCQDDEDKLTLRLSASGKSRKEIEIHITSDNFKVFSVFVNKIQTDLGTVVIIVYDDEVFKQSEILLKEDEGTVNCNNHFKVLAELLHSQSQDQIPWLWLSLQYLWVLLLYVANILLHIVSIAKPVFQYCALGSRLHGFLDTFIWALTSLKSQNKVIIFFIQKLLALVLGTLKIHISNLIK